MRSIATLIGPQSDRIRRSSSGCPFIVLAISVTVDVNLPLSLVVHQFEEAEDPDGYASRVSSTTAIRTPTTPVTAAARGPAAILATATKAVTIAAAARRTTIGEPTWAGPETM